MDFADPLDHSLEIKELQKRGNHLNFFRALKKL